MKSLKSVFAATLLAAGLAGSASAANTVQVVYIAGAPAIRQDANDNITAYVNTFSANSPGIIATSASGTSAAQIESANQNQWLIPNFATGIDLEINATWTGNTAGIESVANGNITQNFIPDGYNGATIASPQTGVNIKNAGQFQAYQPQFILGDTFQASTPFNGTVVLQWQTSGNYQSYTFGALTRKSLAVEPYFFVASPGAHAAGLTNITTTQAQLLFAKGALPLSFFTGNSADHAKWVYGLTRDPGSGARIILQAETGIGVKNTLKTYQPVVSNAQLYSDPNGNFIKGTIASYTVPSGANPVPLYTAGQIASTQIYDPTAGDTGYPSFGGANQTSLLAAITSAPPAGALFVTYFNTVDGGEAVNYGGAEQLTYNGNSYSLAGLAEGVYTFWSYQALFTPSTISGNAATVANWLGTNWTPNYGVPLSSVNVTRTVDGGGVIKNY